MMEYIFHTFYLSMLFSESHRNVVPRHLLTFSKCTVQYTLLVVAYLQFKYLWR